ncbi:unnamed protein product [Chironomus riparius]|uniref:carboxylesterase n=1 Tax=Chironomus riparius TaxID=315576 RepID=A0A9N9RLP4_9DIPT|nr:unnamed protein product [Chironomus riparius]
MLQQIIRARVRRSIKDSLMFTHQKVQLKIHQGTVKGVIENLANGKSFYRFSGIPYARNPEGKLRFKAPEKLLKFEKDVIDCTREGSACFHQSTVTGNYIGSENCLNLNVYAPADAKFKKLPVIVFIHGGGFMLDSNSVDFYSPEYLLAEDVVVVTVNYRLHTLGFLSLPSMGISGNAGLKDQQMALEWVYDNISHFNGDPDNICLFGESAGAASVYLHTLNPKSRRFISSAICNSGTALDTWLYQRDGEGKTKMLAKRVGAKGSSDKDIYDALMSSSTQSLYDLANKVRTPDEYRRSIPFTFKPIVENESDDAFMTESPLELIKGQNGQIKLPMIIGNNSADGMTMTYYFRKNLNLNNEDTVRLVPFFINVDPLSKEAKALGDKISKFYMGNKGVCEETLQRYLDLNSDSYFFVSQTIAANLNKIHNPGMNQYLYEFDFDGELNFMKRALRMKKYKGACHFDDMSYLFRHQIIDVSIRKNSREHKMRDRMCKMWTNFAKYKNPTPKTNNPLPTIWEPVKSTDKDLNYMILDDNPRMVKNIHSDRINFWKEVLEEFNGSFFNPICP